METKAGIHGSMFDEAMLDGMPDCRHAVLPSGDLKGPPVSVRRLGKDLVLWRDPSERRPRSPISVPTGP